MCATWRVQVASAVGPSPTGAPPPSAACSAGQQAAVAAQRGRPTMLQQVAAGRVCSAQQGTPQAGSCSQGVPVMPAQQPTQGSQPAAGGQQQGQGAAAGKLKVMFRPRDTSTKSAVEDCGENSRRQLRIGCCFSLGYARLDACNFECMQRCLIQPQTYEGSGCSCM